MKPMNEKKSSQDWADHVGLDALEAGRPWVVKMGFDPTSPDLHLGHAVGLFALRRLQDQGHLVALVVGDFTAAIGDPSGRDATRPTLDAGAIKENAKTYARQAMKILDESKTRVLFNSQWLDRLGAAGIVQLASQATVAQMLAREDFAKRFGAGEPIGAHELLYPLLQARDSVEIRPDAEVGGSDQRFNLLMGRELMRAAGQKPQACLMVGLLVGLDGKRKMSKSLGNHIALMDSPEDIFAKTMSVSDEAAEQWRQTLAAGETAVEGDPMEAKKRLGEWIARRLSTPAQAESARASWEASRQKGDWEAMAEPRVVEAPEGGVAWASLVRDWGWEQSAAKARDRIAQGALRLDGAKILDPKARAIAGQRGLLRYGAKRAAIFEALAPGAAPRPAVQKM